MKNTSKIKVGDSIKVKWLEEKHPIKGVVENIYRGHRSLKYQTLMEDGQRETVEPDQIV